MDRIRIIGGAPLHGTIRISGAKNAALPLMVASLLTGDSLALANVPNLADINTMVALLAQHGVRVEKVDDSILLNANAITSTDAPYDIVRKMRASIWVLGPLLARFGSAHVSLPGGCAIGTRPVDLHLMALEKLGANITIEEGYINATVDGKLQGAEIYFDKISVGATITAVMAATLAEGCTTIINAAREPEITDVIACLRAMGAKIKGAGTSKLVIEGVDKLHGAHHSVIPDRIEAGTYAVAAVITGGQIELIGGSYGLIENIAQKLVPVGAEFVPTANGVLVRRVSRKIIANDMVTQPYPGFPTDMQAQFMALMAVSGGVSMISETIFENRFMHVPEICRMGGDITVKGSVAMVRGVKHLSGAQVMATDLRASVSLVLAGLVAHGETIINRVYHIDRGYEQIEQKLAACGASIARIC